MKRPKFVLTIAGREYVVPDNKGVATLVNLLSDAVPVNANLYAQPAEIELLYTDPEDERYLTVLQEVRIQRIPAGTKWSRKMRDGRVEIIRPVALEPAPQKRLAPPAKKPKPKALPRPAMLQLEF